MASRAFRAVRRQWAGFLALAIVIGGGTAYATLHLPRNSVRSRNIVNGQVKRPDLAKGAVNGARVKNGSLTGDDIQGGTLQGVNADTLGGLSATDFVRATRVQGGPFVLLGMPPTPGDANDQKLIDDGSLTVWGECLNTGGLAEARVSVENTAELFLWKDSTNPSGAFPITFPPTRHPVADATAPNAPSWSFDRSDYAALTNPPSGSQTAIQGQAAVVAVGPGGTTENECYVSAWGFAG